MKHLLLCLPLYALAALMASCSARQDPPAGQAGSREREAAQRSRRPRSAYFDVVSFVREVEANSAPLALHKSTISSGKEEDVTMKTPHWDRELAAFLAADITKPAWAGAYKITARTDGPDSLITYRATSTKPDLKELRLRKRDGRVQEMSVVMDQDNYLFSSNSDAQLYLTYARGLPQVDSLHIMGSQKIILADKFEYLLMGKSMVSVK